MVMLRLGISCNDFYIVHVGFGYGIRSGERFLCFYLNL